MKRHPLHLLLFLLGLAVVAWIAVVHAVANPWVLLVTLLIGAAYVAGALELDRYRNATATLDAATAGLTEAPTNLDAWLVAIDASLRGAVRLRIDGERAALPAPALSGFLAGLLVLLGMLGTLLGMMATLRGTGIALETASDLQAIRDSLAAPVKGLGFAFGTSIAGIATAAVLGLLAALCRRERGAAGRALDAAIAGPLRTLTPAHRRDEAFGLMQQQAALMPTLVDRLQLLAATLEQNGAAQGDRMQALAATLERQGDAGADRLQALATTIEREGGAVHERQAASQAAFHARTEAIHATLAASVQQSLHDSIALGAEAASGALQPVMQATMSEIASGTRALQQTLVDAVQCHLQDTASGLQSSTQAIAGLWTQALEAQCAAGQAQVTELSAALERLDARFEQRSMRLLDGVSARLDDGVAGIATTWQDALAHQQSTHDALASGHRDAMVAATANFATQSESLLRAVDVSHRELQGALAAQDRERLATWNASLAELGAALREEWTQVGDASAERQQAIFDALARAADEIGEQSRVHAGATIGEVAKLVQAASEAPRVAAEVVGELRQSLSDSMVRDTAMLDERNQLLATLATLLQAVNHASTEQKAAIDALVGTSAELLERVGNRFSDHVDAGAGKLDGMATRLSVGALEVASLGEAFGAAVQAFGDVNERLAGRLERIEGALEKTLSRSDDQLAYYVAQAREVIDLSLLAQKQIVDDLRQAQGSTDQSQAA
ncbi:MAG TPA: DUF802 domain-containing protein [Thermomonas sp.]|nr:DUF802 domain-containing protein [Thermomonas sp.]